MSYLRRNRTHGITQVDFDTIRSLIDDGHGTKEIGKLTGRGAGTITVIRHADSLEDYHLKVKNNYRVTGKTYSPRVPVVSGGKKGSAWNIEEVWTIYDLRFLQSKKYKKIGKIVGRTTHSIEAICSYIRNILECNDITQAQDFVNSKKLSANAAEALLETYRRVHLTNHRPTVVDSPAEITIEMPKSAQGSVVQAIDELDEAYHDLQAKIEKVVTLMVEQGVKEERAAMERTMEEYRKDKETELTALKTVVEAAQSSNLAATLKKRLMGE